jgi:hypothetical protein
LEIHSLDERIRQLCIKATEADESEIESVLAELRAALGDHAQFVRLMTVKTAKALSRVSKNHSPSKVAD